MEWSTRWSYRRSRQPHGIVRLGIEEVEASPTVHEDARQAGLTNDRIYDKGEALRLWNVVGVILSIESDRGFWPF